MSRALSIAACATILVVARHVAGAQQARCGPPASRVVEADTIVRLAYANGHADTLIDVSPGDGQTHYKYRGYLQTIGYHVVQLMMWGGPNYWYELYNACTGVKLIVDDTPIVSPDSTRFVTLGRGVPRKPLVGRIQILSRQARDDDFTVDWDFELSIWAHGQPALDWGPANARWLTPTSIRFDRVDLNGRVMGTATATRGTRGWQFALDP